MENQQIQQIINQKQFPDSAVNSELIETHISWVILTDHYVFKIKKPHQYSFLDFSSLEKRHFYCHRELELNSRLAASMYLTVLPVIQGQGHIAIKQSSDAGESVIDYALQMQRMDPSLEMDELLAKDQVSKEQIQKIANKVADFHQKTEVLYPDFDEKVFQSKFDDIKTTRSIVTNLLGETYATRIDEAVDASNEFINAHLKYLKERNDSGYIRDCHGDLHSKNIFLYDDPIIFDCIEFNDKFRQIDILNEIAFFSMDLEANEAYELSKFGYKAYADAMPDLDYKDEDAFRLFTYFKSYRANVRGKVIALKMQNENQEKIAPERLKQMSNYFDLMLKYLEELK